MKKLPMLRCFLWIIGVLLFCTPCVFAQQSDTPKTSVLWPGALHIPSPQNIGEQAEVRSLLDVLAESKRANLSIARAKALTQAAQAVYQTQVQRWWPALSLQVGAQIFGGFQQGNFGDTRRIPTGAFRFDPLFQISYMLNPANIAFQSRRRFREYRAAQHRQTQTQDAILIATALAYQDVVHAQVHLALLDHSIRELNKLLVLGKARLTAGIGNRAELLQLQGRLAQEEQIRPGIVSRLRMSAIQLTLALGRAPSPLLYAASKPLHAFQLVAWSTDSQTLLSRILQHHPQILHEKEQIRALHYRKQSLSWGTWLPSVDMTLQGGVLTGGLFETPLDTGPQYSMRLALRWTLDASTLGRHRELDHRQVAIHRALQQIRLHLQSQITLTHTQAKLAFSRLTFARRFVKIAHQSLVLHQSRYQSGAGDVLQVIEAQRTLVQARQQILDAIVASNRAQIMLQGLRGQLQPTDFSEP